MSEEVGSRECPFRVRVKDSRGVTFIDLSVDQLLSMLMFEGDRDITPTQILLDDQPSMEVICRLTGRTFILHRQPLFAGDEESD